MSTALTEAIEALINEKTFSMDAIQSIYKLKEKASELEARVQELNKLSEDRQKVISSLEKEGESQRRTISEQTAKIFSLEGTVEKYLPSRYHAERAEAVASAYKYALEVVFKPSSIRESVITSTPITQQYPGGASSVMLYKGEVISEKESI